MRRSGLKLVERNFRSRFGEIDLIMLDDDCLVFVEVRVRGATPWATAAESVDALKQQKLIRTATLFASSDPAWSDKPMRFDVVALDGSGIDAGRLTWISDAFRPGE